MIAASVVNGGGLEVRRLQDVVVSLIPWRAAIGSFGPDGWEMAEAVAEFDSGQLGLSPEEREEDGDVVEEAGPDDDGVVESEYDKLDVPGTVRKDVVDVTATPVLVASLAVLLRFCASRRICSSCSISDSRIASITMSFWVLVEWSKVGNANSHLLDLDQLGPTPD
jgi:hypothetical protein